MNPLKSTINFSLFDECLRASPNRPIYPARRGIVEPEILYPNDLIIDSLYFGADSLLLYMKSVLHANIGVGSCYSAYLRYPKNGSIHGDPRHQLNLLALRDYMGG